MNPFRNYTEADVATHNAKVAGTLRKFVAAVDGAGVEVESKLHEQIITLCRQRGWIVFHGSMAHRSRRTIGEPDFTILANNGRVFFVEAKTKTGKLSREQLGLKLWAGKLGHEIYTIRGVEELESITFQR